MRAHEFITEKQKQVRRPAPAELLDPEWDEFDIGDNMSADSADYAVAQNDYKDQSRKITDPPTDDEVKRQLAIDKEKERQRKQDEWVRNTENKMRMDRGIPSNALKNEFNALSFEKATGQIERNAMFSNEIRDNIKTITIDFYGLAGDWHRADILAFEYNQSPIDIIKAIEAVTSAYRIYQNIHRADFIKSKKKKQ